MFTLDDKYYSIFFKNLNGIIKKTDAFSLATIHF